MANISTFKNRSVVILGLARQGLALARFFCKLGARVTISDLAPASRLAPELAALGDLPVTLSLGGHPESLLDGCALLCLSGGVPPQIPLVQTAIARGIPLSNDSLLTLQLAPCPVIAITGSSGKTTTTTLVGEMLAASLCPVNGDAVFGSPRRVHVGGNMGVPILDRLESVHPEDWIVLELSSFQLEMFDPAIAWGEFSDLGPQIGAILNVTPNHLDRHPSMRHYAQAKFNLLRHLAGGAQVILNGDDPVTASLGPIPHPGSVAAPPEEWGLDALCADMAQELQQAGTAVRIFSMTTPQPEGGWLDGEILRYGNQILCRRAEVKLPGDHNISNLLAAATIAGAAGATLSAMAETARIFTGVAHRLELVATAHGITWINDSIATSPERAVAGLRSFPSNGQTLILLAGGKDKNLSWNRFADEVLDRVDYLIGFGQTGPMIVETVQERARLRSRSAPGCAVVQRLDEGVSLASQAATENTVVLLSPGGTSYDAYRDFEERGEHFRRLVQTILQEDKVKDPLPALHH